MVGHIAEIVGAHDVAVHASAVVDSALAMQMEKENTMEPSLNSDC